MNEDIKELFEIDDELKNSSCEKKDYETAFEKIYERFEGYFGIKTEMEDWLINENGEIIEKSLKEMENFYFKLNKKIYNMLIKKEYKRLNW